MIPPNFKIDIFADGADLDDIVSLYQRPLIKGFTTNPTLMRQAGVEDYEGFARAVLEVVQDKPISFEVFADDLPSMAAQARKIASWGRNVNVKIPVTNTEAVFTGPILRDLSRDGISLNVTAVFTIGQVERVLECLDPGTDSIVSVFAGRIADSGLDPIPYMEKAAKLTGDHGGARLLWASPREVLNIYQADQVGCDIITVTTNLLKKLELYRKDLVDFSLETVKMFYRDATSAGYDIKL